MSENKIFNDPIHGTIKLEPFLVKIIDTPEFQRMRHIKQLGGTYYVYPEAQHNRFEHSIGTAHLAGKLVEHLWRLHPNEIDEKDVLCVKVAGLCHDLGHGPFSHLFEGSFLPRQGIKGWTHEKGSCEMFERLIRRIDPECKQLSIQDRVFIMEMINGVEINGNCWTQEGRSEDKSFLYEIIANKTNGVDVDKWDYFARDCHHLGFANGFDHNRFIECTKVLEVPDEIRPRKRICYRDKEVFNLYEMFHIRFSLHKRAYQHKSANAVEMMICDALCEADRFIKIPGDRQEDGRLKNECIMSECIRNLDCYCNFDDRILQAIEYSRESNMEPARHILKRLATGDKYRLVGAKVLKTKEVTLNKTVRAKYEKAIREFMETKLPHYQHKIRITIFTYNYGKNEKDPIQYCWFYRKDDTPKRIKREEVSSLLPSVFQEHWVQVFFTGENPSKMDMISLSDAFDSWYESHVNSSN